MCDNAERKDEWELAVMSTNRRASRQSEKHQKTIKRTRTSDSQEDNGLWMDGR